jgi:hypothetical protein
VIKDGWIVVAATNRLTLPQCAFAVAAQLAAGPLRAYMQPTMAATQVHLELLAQLLAHADPPVHAVLAASGVGGHFALSWLLTLFAHECDALPVLARVLDAVCAAPTPLFPIYLAAALVLTQRAAVLALSPTADGTAGSAEPPDYSVVYKTLSRLAAGAALAGPGAVDAVIARAAALVQLVPPATLLLAAPAAVAALRRRPGDPPAPQVERLHAAAAALRAEARADPPAATRRLLLPPPPLQASGAASVGTPALALRLRRAAVYLGGVALAASVAAAGDLVLAWLN